MVYELPARATNPWYDPFRVSWNTLVGKVESMTSLYVTNVKDFGATGDGTTDDTIAITNAIAQAATNKGSVYLPAGLYVTSSQTISGTVALVGDGRGLTTLKLKDATHDYMFVLNGSPTEGIRFVRFTQMTLDGNCLGQTNGGLINAPGAVQCVFDQLHFANPYNWAVELAGMSGGAFGHNNQLLSCTFDGGNTSAGYGGGVLLTSNDENFLSNLDFQYMGGAATPDDEEASACILDKSGLSYISGCNFVNGSNHVMAIRLRDISSSTRILGCNFDGVDGHSVRITGSNHIVANNYVSSPSHEGSIPSSGVFIDFGSSNILVANNVMRTSSNPLATASLLRITGDGDPRNNLIVGNQFVLDGAPLIGLCDISTGTAKAVGNEGLEDIGQVVLPKPVTVYYGPDQNDVAPGRTWTTDVKPAADDYTAAPYFGNGTTIMGNFTLSKMSQTSAIEVSLEASGYASATDPTSQFGVVAGVRLTNASAGFSRNYDVATLTFTADSTHRAFSGRKLLLGDLDAPLPIGTYTGAVYFALGDGYTPGNGFTFNLDTSSTMYLRLEEVAV